MANGFTGQVAFEYEGKRYRLTLDLNAMAEFEGKTGKDSFEVVDRYDKTGKISMMDLRALFWAGMVVENPDLTLQDAGLIMSANLGVIKELLAAMQTEPDPDRPPVSDEASPAGKRKARKRGRAA